LERKGDGGFIDGRDGHGDAEGPDKGPSECDESNLGVMDITRSTNTVGGGKSRYLEFVVRHKGLCQWPIVSVEEAGQQSQSRYQLAL